ncbi:MAG: hypothetical protein QM750_05125 [Rubrivivax sp.]
MSRPILLPFCALAAAALLTACGGGGGDAGAGSGRLPLSADNYVRAGQEALAAGLQFEESTELIVGAQVVRRSDASLLNVVLAALRSAGAPALPATATGVVITSSVDCDNAGGRYTLASNDANSNNRYDAGDSLTFTFSNCTLDGDTANGIAVITIKSLSGDLNSDVYNGSFGVTMTALALSGASGRYTGDGQFDVTLVGTAAHTGSETISVGSFKSVAVFGSQTSSRTLTNFTVNETHVPDGSGERSSVRFEGTVATTGFDDRSVVAATASPFVTGAGARYPSSGQALVTGLGSSALRVTVVDGSTVRFELDANGDGVYEATATRAWSELL